jgi:acyl-CoA-dependent ceramide synthase
LKYLGYTTICNVLFGLFIVSWFLARHVFYLMICWSIYADLLRLTTPGCYSGRMDDLKGPFPVPDSWSHVFEPFRNPEGTVCFNDNIMYSFLFCLLFLQVITIMWFVVIMQVAMRVLKGGSAEDVRSDEEAEEDEEDEEEEFEYQEAQPLEEDVGVEDINLKGWERRTGVKRAASSSGVSLPRHSDRKELLNRIGCEKQID